MDRRITIALVAILVLLGGYIWLTFFRPGAPPQTSSTPEPTLQVFFSVNEDAVRAVQVRDLADNSITRVVRDGDVWKMEQPAQGDVNSVRVRSLLLTLARIDAERKLANTGELAGYGLNPPQYELTVELQDGTQYTLSIGNPNPDRDAVYMIKSGDAAVYLIDSTTGEELQEFVTSPPFTPAPPVTIEPPATVAP